MKKIISAIIAGVMALSSVSALAVTSHSDDEFTGLASTERMKEYMKGTVALYIGSNLIAKDGDTTVIDPEDDTVEAYIENDRTLVPLRFVSEALGYNVEYIHEPQSAVITNGEHKLVFKVGDNNYTLDDKTMTVEAAPVITKDRMFVPVRAVAEGFDKKVTYDKCGLIVIGERENYFNMVDDIDIFRRICGELVFNPISGKEMVDTLKANYPENTHPRLLINEDKIATIKEGIATNETMKKWSQDVIKLADGFVGTDLLKHELRDGVRLLYVSRDAKARIENLGFAYYLTGDTKYAERAVSELINVCTYPDWNPHHHLDTAEMLFTVGLGYDWFYDYMTEDQRTVVREGIVNLGLMQTMDDYTINPDRKRSYTWSVATAPDNWNVVCNSGAMVAAMAIADEEEELCETIFNYGLDHIQRAAVFYGPDGAWYEGTGYWEYTTDYYMNLMASFDSVYGDTFGYMNVPGMRETCDYINAMTSSQGMFNFHNASEAKISSANVFYIANYFNNKSLSALRMEEMVKNDSQGSIRDLMWYDYKNPGELANLPLDYYFRDTEVTSMRSNWSDNSAVYTGLHAGVINVNHGHMDAGQFIIDAYGTRFAMDLGPEGYNVKKESLWDLYRQRAEGHNVLVINPSRDGGQSLKGATKIDKFESGEGCAYSVSDLTSAYEDQAKSVKRGVKLTNNRSMVIVQDEFNLNAPSEVYWFMHTKCDIEVAEDGKSAIVKGATRDMHVYLLEDVNGTFTVMDALPLPSSPVNEEQSTNKGIRKLAFHMDNVQNETLAIAFAFEAPGVEIDEYYRPEVVALDNWTLDVSEVKELPVLTDLKINGESVEGFASDILGYTYRVRAHEATPVVTGEGTGNVTVKMPEGDMGNAIISVSAKENDKIKTNYVLTIKKEILKDGPEGTEPLSILNVEASHIPQPQNGPWNSVDNSLDTRWSAKGKGVEIIYDVESVREITHIGLAVYQDTNANDYRRQFFEVWTSEDGENWTQVLTDETSGTTLEQEVFEVTPTNARYIKIVCNNTSVGEWNSITEFTAYAKK